MATWTFSDSTKVETGGKVTGFSDVAGLLTSLVDSAKSGAPPQVEIVAPPAGGVPLRLDNDWLVDQWLRQVAARFDLTIETDFDAAEVMIPEDAQALIDEAAKWSEPEDGLVY